MPWSYALHVAYNPIRETWQLPLKGPLPEDLRFDMKMELKERTDKKSIEQRIEDLACDVAAFANTVGGVLLVGAYEDPPGTLKDYVPMSSSDAHAVGDALKRALELCSPKPIAEAKPIALHDRTGFAVAINCDPYAAPPIGVEKPVPGGGRSGGAKWWAFPARRGRDNPNLRPEELATIMEPRLRRMTLLLDRIPTYPTEHRRRARFRCRAGSVNDMDILSIDANASSLRLIGLQKPFELVLPLDAVRMIWRDANTTMFQVSIDGKIQETNDGYEFIPT